MLTKSSSTSSRCCTASGLFRATPLVLARPFGPLSTQVRINKFEYLNRTEQTMSESLRHRPEFMSMREQNLENPKNTHVRAIPRDLGQIPRDYLMRLLYFNQPCTTDTLWTLAKADDSCPLDSKKHMKSVMKIASLQDWVVFEKNQTNNLFYASVHPSKSKEAQDLLYQHRKKTELAEREAAKRAENQRQQDRAQATEALDMAIQQLQHQLITSVVKLQEHNPDLIHELDCVTENGGIDFFWYDETKKGRFLEANDNNSDEEEEGEKV